MSYAGVASDAAKVKEYRALLRVRDRLLPKYEAAPAFKNFTRLLMKVCSAPALAEARQVAMAVIHAHSCLSMSGEAAMGCQAGLLQGTLLLGNMLQH